MDNIDKLIAEALAHDDAPHPEPGYFALAFSIFGGRQGWVAWVIMLAQTVMFLVSVWCLWQFFAATEVLAAVKWGLSGATLLIVATQTKLSLMPVMQANRVLLAIRRLELLLASQQMPR